MYLRKRDRMEVSDPSHDVSVEEPIMAFNQGEREG